MNVLQFFQRNIGRRKRQRLVRPILISEVLEDRSLLSSLSIGDLVFEDRNANGTFDAGTDVGISGVTVNLHRDDGSSAGIRDAVDTHLGFTVTDESGQFQFANLVAGSYLLEVSPFNFEAAQPLAGMISVGGTASPENNVDGDDNGDPLALFGVTTIAVALTENEEPVSEDGDPNTNFTIDFGFVGMDFGDAPSDLYPTRQQDDGPRHLFGAGLFLGVSSDTDQDAGPGNFATGDDLDADGDDDDGVVWTSDIVPGRTSTVDITASENGFLNAWIDFNADGDWDDAGEHVFYDVAVIDGINSLQIDVPADASSGRGPEELDQWLKLTDQTSSKLILDTIPDDDAEEKDIAVGDLDRDGWTDVVVVRKAPFSAPGKRTDVLLMNEQGVLTDRTSTFAPQFVSLPSDARDVMITDLTGDGWDDVMIATTFDDLPRFYRNLGEDSSGNWLGLVDESASRIPDINIPSVQFCALWAGDVNGDGHLDLYFSNYHKFQLALDVLLINDGTGHFTDESESRLGNLRNSGFGTSVEIKDVDLDGDNDIIKLSVGTEVAPWNAKGVFILYNDGDGTFTNFQQMPGQAPYMFTAGDLTNNGLLDYYMVDDFLDYVNLTTEIVTVDSEVTLERRFVDSNGTLAFGGNVRMADLDNDGDLDVGLADVDTDLPPCESDRHFLLFENEGDASGVLSDPWLSPSNAWNQSSYDLAFIDINNDGRLDLIQGRCHDYAVFMNDGINIPATETFARFRVSTSAGLSYTGAALDGEVEDYAVTIAPAPALPALSVQDAAVSEASQEGTIDLTVTLTEPSDDTVTVAYQTVDNSATAIETVRIASGLDRPVFATSAPGNSDRLFILEQHTGRIQILNTSTSQLNATPFLQITDLSTGNEQGLLGLTFDPEYSTNGFFYVSHTDSSDNLQIVRYNVSGDPELADPFSAMPIIQIAQPQENHNGGWLDFGPDNYLYVATGDGGGAFDQGSGHTSGTGNAQDVTDNLLGKLLRLDVTVDDFPADPTRNYGIPPSNPFVATTGDDEIWAFGLRNPWRNSFDRFTGDLFIADVGQIAREEINFQPANATGGTNYGWRLREGTIETVGGGVGGAAPPGTIEPIYDYERGTAAFQGRSVTGGYVYRGPIAELHGQYFFSDFISGGVWSLAHDGSDVASFDGTNFNKLKDWTNILQPDQGAISNVASFGEDNAGNLYIVDFDGEIFVLRSGGDYVHSSGSLTFAPGETSKTVSVTVLDDDIVEDSEEFELRLSVPVGATIATNSAIVTILDDDVPSLDIDASGLADAATDGILMLRYLFGFRGSALINGAVGDNASSSSSANLESTLAGSMTILDVDGNGIRDAATDGILLIRYLFGFRDEALVGQAIGPGATRTTGTQVADYLDSIQNVPQTPQAGETQTPAFTGHVFDSQPAPDALIAFPPKDLFAASQAEPMALVPEKRQEVLSVEVGTASRDWLKNITPE